MRASVFIMVSALVGACADEGPSDDGVGGDGDTVGTPGVAEIVFPPGRSATDATQITIRGVGSDLQRVRVNGVPAVSDDGFATWTAEVPLEPGVNVIAVDAVTVGGAAIDGVARTTIVQRSLVPAPFAGVLVTVGGNGIAYASSGRDVIATNLATGRNEVLAARALWTGGEPLEVNRAGTLLFVADGTIIDTATGSVTPPSHDRDLESLQGMALNEATSQIWVASARGLYRYTVGIDGVTQFRTGNYEDVAIAGNQVLALTAAGGLERLDAATGALISQRQLALPSTPATALAVDEQSGTTYAVAGGVLFDIDDPTTSAIGENILDIELDPDGQIVASMWGSPYLEIVDPASGASTIVYDQELGEAAYLHQSAPAAIGTRSDGSLAIVDAAGATRRTLVVGEDLQRRRGAVLDGYGPTAIDEDLVLAIDQGRSVLIASNVATGETRNVVELPWSGNAVASGSLDGNVYVSTDDQLYEVHLETGLVRSIASFPFGHDAVAVDRAQRRVLMSAHDGYIASVDVATGNVTRVPLDVSALPDPERFVALGGANGVVYAKFIAKEYLTHESRLVAIDVETGRAVTVSGPMVGDGPSLDFTRHPFDQSSPQTSQALTVDPRSGLLLMLTSHLDAPIYIDPRSGDRVVRVRALP